MDDLISETKKLIGEFRENLKLIKLQNRILFFLTIAFIMITIGITKTWFTEIPLFGFRSQQGHDFTLNKLIMCFGLIGK